MRHLTLWICVLLFAVGASAQMVTIKGSSGWGTARSEDDKLGVFRYEVKQVTRNDTGAQVVEGFFHFTTVNPQTRIEVKIDLVKPISYEQSITDVGKVAEFKGPAVLSARTPQGGRRVVGHLAVRVQDNRPPNAQQGKPDVIALRFVPRDSGRAFEFEGKVVRGDILIFERQR